MNSYFFFYIYIFLLHVQINAHTWVEHVSIPCHRLIHVVLSNKLTILIIIQKAVLYNIQHLEKSIINPSLSSPVKSI